VSPLLACVLLVLIVFQGVLGMLTVTWQLKPLIVTLHLLFGLTTLSLLWWLWLGLRKGARGGVRFGGAMLPGGSERRGASTAPRRLAALALVLLAIQIALGGWTSSNYAAVACPDFPKCQNSWWPETAYGDAFVLWRGLGVNYEGGVLEQQARVAIHLTHRIGALLTTLVLAAAAVMVLRRRGVAAARPAALVALATLALQLAIGISMVVAAFPLLLATAHNAGAALLLLATISLNRQLSRSA
jgi:cytochrome c oxidase assembly protein subunit 15